MGRLELTCPDKDKTLLSTGDGRYDYAFVEPSDYRVSEVPFLHRTERAEVRRAGTRGRVAAYRVVLPSRQRNGVIS